MQVERAPPADVNASIPRLLVMQPYGAPLLGLGYVGIGIVFQLLKNKNASSPHSPLHQKMGWYQSFSGRPLLKLPMCSYHVFCVVKVVKVVDVIFSS